MVGGLMVVFVFLIGGLLLLVFVSVDDEIVKIGYFLIIDVIVFLVVYGMGYFEEEGFKVDCLILICGWLLLVEGFVFNKFNLVYFLKLILVWMCYNNKILVKLMVWVYINGFVLVVGGYMDIIDFS